MTAVAEDLDLDRWVTFSGSDRACRWRDPQPQCGLEAVAAAVWDVTCHPGVPNPQDLCAGHRDQVAAHAAASPVPLFRCDGCGRSVRLLRIEPLR